MEKDWGLFPKIDYLCSCFQKYIQETGYIVENIIGF